MALPEQHSVFPVSSGQSQNRAQKTPRDSDPEFRGLFKCQISEEHRRGGCIGRMQLGMRPAGHQQVSANSNQYHRDQPVTRSMECATNMEIHNQRPDGSKHHQKESLPAESIRSSKSRNHG